MDRTSDVALGLSFGLAEQEGHHGSDASHSVAQDGNEQELMGRQHRNQSRTWNCVLDGAHDRGIAAVRTD
jgi:hypothetical protein